MLPPRPGVGTILQAEASKIPESAREPLHSALRKIDELAETARSVTPSQLLAEIVQSGLIGKIKPDAPPYGVKLLAEELAAATEAEAGRLPPLGSVSSQQGTRDTLAVLKQVMENGALAEYEKVGGDHRGGRATVPAVTLSTIHGAKGREWRVVIIVRCNEEHLPLSIACDDDFVGEASQERLYEERRLMYVAMTRAMQQLFISYVTVGADSQPLPASRFLRGLPPERTLRTQHFDTTHASANFGASTSQTLSSWQSPSLRPYEGASLPAGAIGESIQRWMDKRAANEQKKAEKHKRHKNAAVGMARNGYAQNKLEEQPKAISALRSKRSIRKIVVDDDDFA